MPEPEIVLNAENITRCYGEKAALDNVSFSLSRGEIVAVIGPSGAGKSTLLRICDMLEEQNSGNLTLFGTPVSKKTVRTLRERVGILFQKTILFNRTVADNIALGLRFRKMPAEEISTRVAECLKTLGMDGYAERRARTLSGGEGQRIAFARVLLTEPDLLLLDEPTANLDPLATRMLEEMIRKENSGRNTTILINTHDQNQGMRLADRIIVLMNGRIEQIGTPDEIFYRPATLDAARFVGFQNLIPGTVKNVAGGIAEIATGTGILRATADHGILPGSGVTAALRAEEILLEMVSLDTDPEENRLTGTILSATKIGPVIEILADCGIPITAAVPGRHQFTEMFRPGTEIQLSWKASSMHLLRGTDSTPTVVLTNSGL